MPGFTSERCLSFEPVTDIVAFVSGITRIVENEVILFTNINKTTKGESPISDHK